MKTILWIGAALALAPAPVSAFNPEVHQDVLKTGNFGNAWRSKELEDVRHWNAWVDWGCAGVVHAFCLAEWHIDDDYVYGNKPSSLSLIDDAWAATAVARPSGRLISVRAVIKHLWDEVKHGKSKYCKTPKQGCLKRALLGGLDRTVREHFGVRSHSTHDFYSHTLYVESQGCADVRAFTKKPSVAFNRSASRLRDSIWPDSTLRSGFWMREHLENRIRHVIPVVWTGTYEKLTTEDGTEVTPDNAVDHEYKIAIGGGPSLSNVAGGIFLHDGLKVETPDGKTHFIHGANKDKDWGCTYPCIGGGFCDAGTSGGFPGAFMGAVDTQREENRRLCNTIKRVVLKNGGNSADVAAMWFYVAGTSACGCTPTTPDQIYWAD